MRKPLLICTLVAFLGLVPLSPASGGVEPSPFHNVRDQLTTIGQRFTLPGELSLDVINSRLAYLELNPPRGWVTDPISARWGAILLRISGMLADPAFEVTADEAVRLVRVMDRVVAGLFDPQPEPPGLSSKALDIASRVSAALCSLGTQPPRLLVQGIDVMDRLSAAALAPQLDPPRVVADGLGTLERISSILFDPQPEPPGVMIQGFNVMERISSVMFDPQPEPPGVFDKALSIIQRVVVVGFDPQPEPPGVALQAFNVMDRVSAVLFDPQPEPPGVASQAFNVMDRISAVMFDPQPEPPGLPFDLEEAMAVEFMVSGTMLMVNGGAFGEAEMAGLTALDRLSGHLVTAVALGNAARATAQVHAMVGVAQQFAAY